MNLKGGRGGNEGNEWEAVVALMRHDLAKMLVSVKLGEMGGFRICFGDRTQSLLLSWICEMSKGKQAAIIP